MRTLLVMFTIGCGGTPVPVNRVMVGGEMQPKHPLPEEMHACTPARHVTVVTANGTPVAGARVDVEQRVSEHAIEETLAVWSYRAVSARTDARGRAMICEPSELSPRPRSTPSSFNMEGIGGGYTDHGDGQIVVTVAGKTTIVNPPFDRELRIVIPSALER
jgi:hypothetical protein